MNDTLEDIDLRFFLIVDGLSHEPCEGRHRETHTECSGTVVALFHSACGSGAPRKVCQSCVDYVKVAQAAGSVCMACFKGTRECWRIMAL